MLLSGLAAGCSPFAGYLVPQSTGNYYFRMAKVDNVATMWLDTLAECYYKDPSTCTNKCTSSGALAGTPFATNVACKSFSSEDGPQYGPYYLVAYTYYPVRMQFSNTGSSNYYWQVM